MAREARMLGLGGQALGRVLGEVGDGGRLLRRDFVRGCGRWVL